MTTATLEEQPVKLTVRLEEAARMIGCGRSTIYEEAKSGAVLGCPVLKVGRRIALSRARLEAVLAGEIDPREPTAS